MSNLLDELLDDIDDFCAKYDILHLEFGDSLNKEFKKMGIIWEKRTRLNVKEAIKNVKNFYES